MLLCNPVVVQICDLLCENESDVGNFRNWVICMAGKNTSAAVIWYVSKVWVYRVAELLPFEISHYTIFCENGITSKIIF